MLKNILAVLVVLLVAAQFVRPAKNLSTAASPNEINVKYPVPAEVKAVLERACYDCHSNQTRYPWYAEVQPVAWWLDRHIKDGKRHLNFSEFGSYPVKRATKKMAEVAEEVTHHEMPLASYTWMHAEARLTPAEIKLLADWGENLSQAIAAGK